MALAHQDLHPVDDESGRLYRLIADTIPHMVWAARADGGLDFFNRRCHEYTGLDSGGLQGWGWKAVVHAEDWEKCLSVWTRALQSGERYEIEYRLRRSDGVYRWHQGTAVPIRDGAGHVLRWFGTCTDIEGQIRSAQILESMVQERTLALRESERRFQAFMDHSPAVAWIKDASLRYTYISRPYEEAFGRPHGEVLGKDDFQLCPESPARNRRAQDEQVLASGAAVQTLRSARDAAGRERHWLVVKFPVTDAAGALGVGGIGIDITERHRLDRALAISERRFQAFMEHLPAVGWIRDSQSKYVYVNRSFEEQRGVRRENLLGRTPAEFFPAPLAARIEASDRRSLEEGGIDQYFEDVQAADGKLRRYLTIKFPVPEADGKIAVGGIALDVTERNRLEHALLESEQRFRTFMESMPAIGFIKDAKFCYTYVNPMHERVHDRKAEHVRGRGDFALWPEHIAKQFRKNDLLALEAGGPIETVEEVPKVNGRIGSWFVVKFPVPDPAGGTGVAGIAVDMTERVEAEQTVHRYAADVRRLMSRLVSAQELERRRVADELHDLIGQNLTALGIELGTLRAGLPPNHLQTAAPRLDSMTLLLEGTIGAIRGVMTELRPPALEEYGLLPALRSYMSLFEERTGMKAVLSHLGRERRLPRETELTLFRIVQEALTNAAKHSGGTAVRVAMADIEGGVRITVEDDGRGFVDPAGARMAQRGGWGLPAMRERAEAHGGELRIEFPGRGARLVVETPCSDADPRPAA